MTDYQKYLVDEYLEDYEKGLMSRRRALKMVAAITGSVAVANGLLAACARAATDVPAEATAAASPTALAAAAAATAVPSPEPTGVPAAAPDGVRVAEDDPAISAGPMTFPGDGAMISAYLALPTGGGPFPTILVCHENRGLTPYVENVARRLAKSGYAALAVDLLSREGGTASLSDDEIPGILGNAPPEQFAADFIHGWEYLKTQPFTNVEAVGMVGFCFGGGVTWSVATKLPELKAAVPFYGPPPPVEDLVTIEAAVLAVYAGNDDRINASIPDVEAAMAEGGKVYEKAVFPDVDHAFHNDTRERYNPEQAEAAWGQTMAWFSTHLQS